MPCNTIVTFLQRDTVLPIPQITSSALPIRQTTIVARASCLRGTLFLPDVYTNHQKHDRASPPNLTHFQKFLRVY
jgi:hypothetical protein